MPEEGVLQAITITEPAHRNLKLVYGAIGNQRVIVRVEERATSVPTEAAGRQVEYNYVLHNNSPELTDVVYYGTLSAHYTYQDSNLSGNPPNPRLISTCDDPMYSGAMSRIAYVFNSGTGKPHGFILSENYLSPDGLVGSAVSTLDVVNDDTRTETRGDGPSRTFNYSKDFLPAGQTSCL